jgi:hypothetical protein
VCSATVDLGVQFVVEMSSCLQAKVSFKDSMFDSLRIRRDVQVRVKFAPPLRLLNLTSL